MAMFHYEAVDAGGREVKSELEALSGKEAVSKICNMGYHPVKVVQKGLKARPQAVAGLRQRAGAGARVKAKLVCRFARQLSTLQDAGLTILRSLQLLQRQQRSKGFKRIIGYVADDIENGETLSEAMGRYPRCFNKLFVNMVAAGETGGVLDVTLSRMADFMEKSERLKARMKSAMIYPTVVLSAAFLIVMGLMAFVIPRITPVLKEMTGKRLPWITQTLIDVGEWVRGGGWALIFASIIAVIMTMKLVRRTSVGRVAIDRLTLRLPIVGQIAEKSSVARWTRTLGTLLGAGVPILDAVAMASETAGNAVYAAMLGKVSHAIRQGDSFTSPLRAAGAVDEMVVDMIDVGDQTGDMDKMMNRIADQYDEEVDVLVGSLMSLMEPLIIVILGAVVLVIVLAIFMPILGIFGSGMM